MRSLELLPEALELLLFTLGTAALSLFSANVERFAFALIQDGNLTLGLWAGYMGMAVLLAAYTLGTEEVVPRVADLAGDASD